MPIFSQLKNEYLQYYSEKAKLILTELLETEKRLSENNITNILVFFGSARILPKELAKEELKQAKKIHSKEILIDKITNKLEISKYYDYAMLLSKKLSLWAKNSTNNKYYICTGGGPGIMEAANKGAYLANYPSLGFNINLPFEQNTNHYISKELVFNFKYFFMRKFWFAYLAKAIVVFPGGFGTLDEIFEIFTLRQTNKLSKQIPVVVFGSDFFNNVWNLETMLKYSLIDENDCKMFMLTDNVDEAFHYITTNLMNNNSSE